MRPGGAEAWSPLNLTNRIFGSSIGNEAYSIPGTIEKLPGVARIRLDGSPRSGRKEPQCCP